MSKSTGKTILSVAGLFFGAFNPTAFGFKAGVNWAAGVMGASLFGNIWSATHKPKAESATYSFEVLQNTANADARIPVIYGTRKWGGYQTWHSTSSDKTTLTKDILLCEGQISEITNVKANNIPIGSLSGCSSANYLGSPTQSPPSNYDTVGGYKNCAWIRATLKSSDQLQGSNPTITCIIKGCIIKDTRSNTTAYSENPAMIVRDYLLSKRYGLGRWIDSSMIDDDTFKECADYCDEVIAYYVPNTLSTYDAVQKKIAALQLELDQNPGYSDDTKDSITDSIDSLKKSLLTISTQPVSQELVTAPRYTTNIILADKQSHIDDLSQLLATFGGFLVFNGNKIGLKMEKDTEVSYNFTDDNICKTKEGKVDIKWETTGLADAPNQYSMKFYDPANEYVGVKIQSNDFGNQSERGKVVAKEVTLAGVTSQSQALRLGRMYLAKTKMCYGVCTFSTGTYAMHLQPGDVITITHGILLNQPMRITQIAEDNGKWTIKCQQWNASIYSDYLDQSITYKNYTTVPNAFTDVVPNVTSMSFSQLFYIQSDGTSISTITGTCVIPYYYYYEAAEIYYSIDSGTTWKFLVQTSSGEFTLQGAIVGDTYLFKAIVVSKVSRRSNGFISDGVYCTGKDTPPPNVTGLAASVNAADRTKATIEWTKVTANDLRGYNISFNGTTYFTSANSYSMYSSVSNPTVSVVAVDNSGNTSVTPATIVVPIVSSPSNVTGLACIQKSTDRSILAITWSAVADTDVSQYEVRIGDAWNSGVMIDRTKALGVSYQLTSSGYYKVFVAAINSAGIYSSNPTGTTITAVCEPNTPAGLAFVQDSHNSENVILSWNPSPGLDIFGYEVYRDGVYIATSRSATYTDVVTISATYQYKIRAKTVGGFFSGYANLTATIVLEPLDVTGFTGKQLVTDNSIIRLTWDPSSKSDLSYYEIREGSSWDNGTVTEAHVVGTYVDVVIYEERAFTWWIKAVTTAGFKSLYPSEFQSIFNLNPSAVGTIQIVQSASDRTVLNIQWSQVTDGDLKGYQVKVGESWDSAEPLPFTQELYTSYTISTTGSVKVMIKSMNTAGYYSDETETSGYFTVEPTNCTNFIGYQNGTSVELYWDKSVDIDVVSYEIREGATFSQGSLVASGVTLSEYTVPVDSEKDYHYHIKAISSSGNYSLSSLDSYVTVANLPVKNVIETFDEISLQTGTSTKVEFGPSLINFSNLGGRFSDYPTTRFSDIGGRTVLKLVNTNGVYVTSGEYLCQQIDIGSIITANVTVNFVSTVVLKGSGSAILQIRTSQDGSAWIGWNTFKPVQYTFRYAQFKVLLGTTDTSKTPEVNQCLISIDVPDTDIAKTTVIPQGGTTVNYGHTFYTVPVVTPMAIGDGLHAVLVSKTTTGCTVKIKNESNTDVGGTADIRIKGY